MTDAPEFSRSCRLDQIGAGDLAVNIAATRAEGAALATRFDLAAVRSLTADIVVRRDAAVVLARGRVRASVVQHCVATRDPVPATIDEAFTLRFVPQPTGTADEVELTESDVDTIFYAGGVIDLGEVAAETMALALDPFPRTATAGETLRANGVVDESEAEPIAKPGGLAGLRELLGKR